MAKNLYAVLTGDLVDYSKLEAKERTEYVNNLREILSELRSKNLVFEIFRGDSFQAVLPSSRDALKVALIIRSYVISRKFDSGRKIKPDVKIAIGIGNIENYNERNISSCDGEAFRNSGPSLDRMDKKRQRLFIKTNWPILNRELKTECALLDAITARWTSIQAETIYNTLLGKKQSDIAELFNISQSNVSLRLNAANFDAITVMMKRYTEIIDGGVVHIFLNEMNTGDAGPVLECLVKRHPDSPVFHREYGSYLSDKGDHREAVDEYYKALAKDPDDLDTRISLIHDLIESDHLSEAEEKCDEILRITEDSVPPLFFLGKINEMRGNLSEAEKYYRKASLSTGDDDFHPKEGLIRVLFNQNKSEEAEEEGKKFLKLHPLVIDIIEYMYLHNLQKGEGEKAIEYVLKGIESLKNEIKKIGENTELLFDLANLNYLGDKYPEAEIILTKIIEKEPDNQDAHSLLARIYSLRGEYLKAEKEIGISIGLDPKNSTNYFVKGQILQNMEKHQDAKNNIEKSIKMNPGEPTAYFSLGISEYALGNPEKARILFKKAHDMNSSLPTDENMISDLNSGSFDGRDS